MPNFKRIGGGEWKPSVDLTWNDPGEALSIIRFYSIFLIIKAHLLSIDLDILPN